MIVIPKKQTCLEKKGSQVPRNKSTEALALKSSRSSHCDVFKIFST